MTLSWIAENSFYVLVCLPRLMLLLSSSVHYTHCCVSKNNDCLVQKLISIINLFFFHITFISLNFNMSKGNWCNLKYKKKFIMCKQILYINESVSLSKPVNRCNYVYLYEIAFNWYLIKVRLVGYIISHRYDFYGFS